MSESSTQQEIVEVIGLDVGDRRSVAVIMAVDSNDIQETVKVETNPAALAEWLATRPPSRVVFEVGTHSPWIEEVVEAEGHEAVVANARKLQLISQNHHKGDRADGEILARLGRADASLLSPIQHRSRAARRVRALLHARELLIGQRRDLVNHCRGVVKSWGTRLPSCSPQAFPSKAAPAVPDELAMALDPLVEQIAQLSQRIAAMDRKVEELGKNEWPSTKGSRQVGGIGPLTSLCFAVTIEDPHRFERNRNVGSYVGLAPGRGQSGEWDPELPITCRGDRLLRSLLVQAAHYILSERGEDSELRAWGLELVERGGSGAKQKAVIAVARKLAVLMLSLWKSGADYDPWYQTRRRAERLAADASPTQNPA